MVGCVHREKQIEPCITQVENIGYRDMKFKEAAKEGCIRRYGEGACLVKFIKRGELNYWAVCRRAGTNGPDVQERVEVDPWY